MQNRSSQDSDIAQIKTPPHSIEAEQAVLGGLLLDRDAWDRIDGLLSPSDFYSKNHRIIFETIYSLYNEMQTVDILTVSDHLKQREMLEDVGGLPYLATLAQDMPSVSNIAAYANIVYDRSVIRKLIAVGTNIADSGFNPDGRSSNELIQFAEQAVFAIAEQGTKQDAGLIDIRDVLKSTIARIDELAQSQGGVTGAPTGWDQFDEMTSGLQNGDMIVVAGRPSMGKTTIAMNMVERVAMYTNKPVAIFSLEMPAEQLVMRMFASIGGIEQGKIRTGELNEIEAKKLSDATKTLAQTKIFIDDTSGLSPSEMRSRARRLQRDHGQLGLVMVDYLQLMSIPGMSDNRVAEVSEISRSLKLMARELNCPVIVLSQLNRSLEQRPNKRPVMSDLRDSGAIEQDADLICFVYRDEVYNEDSPEKGIAEVIIAKQRNGPIGTVKLSFQGRYSRFMNLSTRDFADQFIDE
ncbi:replicative DNA helicase [Ignatzschineria cameli]|uniref:Replicative DNA helicase n=1 Tax=Ignatzschineria cameli TaxID=2182793 RepID=A0A2U2AQH1_9GAMM|nr:replicative DNA helicase [Ignatzschineria cameli]PWD85885.1 replicative DNA helicase [Ignatzschineria cameli]PWD89513.1 replicative DNA helicase [Ignatzschineria cameli]PWD90985.1 replicative DNA helicase [Ignatzschineria cameli]PWD91773.1 replicative DNA helicase [Ignatzschineria cameli]